MIVDLDFVAVVDGHPFLARLDGDANEDAGIVVEIAHLVDHADAAVGELAAGPIEKAHAAVRSNEPVFDGHVAWSNVLPASEILAVEKRVPGWGLRLGGSERKHGRDGSDQWYRDPFARVHGEMLLVQIKPRRGAACPAPSKTNQNWSLAK